VFTALADLLAQTQCDIFNMSAEFVCRKRLIGIHHGRHNFPLVTLAKEVNQWSLPPQNTISILGSGLQRPVFWSNCSKPLASGPGCTRRPRDHCRKWIESIFSLNRGQSRTGTVKNSAWDSACCCNKVWMTRAGVLCGCLNHTFFASAVSSTISACRLYMS